MPASKHVKLLSVRLPEADLRRYKSVALNRGLTVQEAVYQALESWASKIPTFESDDFEKLEGSLAGIDVMGLLKKEKQAGRRKERLWS